MGFVENIRLTGGSQLNAYGNDLNNTIYGNAGNNVIAGGKGADNLYGKGGADTFYFNDMGAGNRDFIWDFDRNDMIHLGGRFVGLDKNNDGHLDDGAFQVVTSNAQVTGAAATLLYNSKTGFVSYDDDGAGAHAAKDIVYIGTNKTFFDADLRPNSPPVFGDQSTCPDGCVFLSLRRELRSAVQRGSLLFSD